MTAPRNATEITAPITTPARFGLLSVATVQPMGPHERHGVTWEQSAACAQARSISGYCQPTAIDLDDQDFYGVPWAGGAPVTVYAEYDCTAVGRDPERARQLVTDRLDMASPRELERAVWTGRDSTSAVIPDARSLAESDVLVDGDAVDLIGAMGLLEEWLGLNYAGQGVIHAPRKIGSTPVKMSAVGSHMETPLGTQVALYTGSPNSSPDGLVAADGTAWLYATGAVIARRGADVIVPEDIAQGLNYRTNDLVALAMRPYLVAWECGSVAVLANLPTNY